MKKQSGFTLIELLVAMAVLGLIMGAMVHLFGSSVTSLHVGARQEVVYEEARLLMNELKTTLRYADSINPQNPDDKISYSGTMWNRHMDIGAADADNISYDITVEWFDAGGGLKQLKVIRTDKTKNGSKRTKEIYFPNDSANSLFKGDSAFPITSESIKLKDGNSVIMYKIALPVQYEFNGQMKTQTLETEVVPSKDTGTSSIESQLMKAYEEILMLGIKVKITLGLGNPTKPNESDLTVKEYELYNDFMNKIQGEDKRNNSSLTSNDSIRKYLIKEKFDGTWPIKNINGVDLYIQPYCHLYNNDPKTSNIFIYGSTKVKDTSTNDWNTNYIYNMEAKSWYTGNKTIGIANKSWSTVKSEMQSKGWTSVK